MQIMEGTYIIGLFGTLNNMWEVHSTVPDTFKCSIIVVIIIIITLCIVRSRAVPVISVLPFSSKFSLQHFSFILSTMLSFFSRGC